MIVSYKEFKKLAQFNFNSLLISLISANHWFLKSFDKKSVYFGYWIETDNFFYKLLENINFQEEINEIIVINEKKINLSCKDNSISIYLDSQGLNIKAFKPTFITLEMDFRKLYEISIKDNNFKVIPQENSFFIISDDNVNINIVYEGSLRFVNKKIKVFYDYDKERNSSFFQNEIFQNFEGYVSYLKIFSPDKKPDLLQVTSQLNNFLLKRIFSLFSFHNGFRAGLPWFPQRWFRDELISLLFLKINENSNLNFFKNKIFDYYLQNLEKIWNLNKENDGSLSADTFLLLVINLDKKLIEENKKKILDILNRWIKFFEIYEDKLPAKSTWMDTIERKRAIEIDFLFYLTLLKLSLNNEAKKFKMFIKNKIYSNKYPEEEFLRPNLFFCYFLDKNFFDNNNWEKFFDNLIKNNYLDWGGFSSLNKNHQSFQNKYSGENSLSYHQGDSWFWLNNLAYYALKDLNFKKYFIYTKKIRKAIMKNLLKMGVPGYLSELSSAEELKYEGSPIQLWSLSSLYYNFRNGGRSSIG